MACNISQFLMAALETTYGTSATPTGVNAIRARDPKLTALDGTVLERPGLDGQFGNALPGVMAELKNGVAFDIEAV